MTWLAFFGVVMSGMGLALLYGGLREWLRRRAIFRNPVTRMAKILRLDDAPPDANNDGDLHDWYVPVIGYIDDQGNSHTAELPLTSDKKAYPVGKKIAVLFQRDNPENVIEQGNQINRASLVVGLAFGLGLLLFGFMLIFGSTQQ